MATPENSFKNKFARKYWAHNPSRFVGPVTLILDTIVKTKPPKENP